ncbi:hypothetical protein D3C78_1895400 [compost metagenome]
MERIGCSHPVGRVVGVHNLAGVVAREFLELVALWNDFVEQKLPISAERLQRLGKRLHRSPLIGSGVPALWHAVRRGP